MESWRSTWPLAWCAGGTAEIDCQVVEDDGNISTTEDGRTRWQTLSAACTGSNQEIHVSSSVNCRFMEMWVSGWIRAEKCSAILITDQKMGWAWGSGDGLSDFSGFLTLELPLSLLAVSLSTSGALVRLWGQSGDGTLPKLCPMVLVNSLLPLHHVKQLNKKNHPLQPDLRAACIVQVSHEEREVHHGVSGGELLGDHERGQWSPLAPPFNFVLTVIFQVIQALIWVHFS